MFLDLSVIAVICYLKFWQQNMHYTKVLAFILYLCDKHLLRKNCLCSKYLLSGNI